MLADKGNKGWRNIPVVWTPVFEPVALYVYALPSFPYHVRKSQQRQQREEGNVPSFCAARPVSYKQ